MRVREAGVLLLATAAGGVLALGIRSAWAVPGSPGGTPAGAPRWQYTCVTQQLDEAQLSDANTKFNELGSRGWEMAVVAPAAGGKTTVCLKRIEGRLVTPPSQ